MEQANNEDREHAPYYCPECYHCRFRGMRSGWDCPCGYGHIHIHRHFFLRLILAVVVAALVFYVGVKVGEIKSAFSGYFYGRYSDYGTQQPYPYQLYNGGYMMGGGYAAPVGAPTSVAPTK